MKRPLQNALEHQYGKGACVECKRLTEFGLDCIVCDDGPFCSECRLECACRDEDAPSHFLCNRDMHGCNYSLGRNVNCGVPVCKKNTLKCMICMGKDGSYCQEHFGLIKFKLKAYAAAL